MLLSLFAAKGGNTKNIYIKSAKYFYTRSAYISNIFTRGTCTGNVFSTVNVCIKSASPDGISTKGADRESAYTKGAYAIKDLRVYLNFFSISEIELFDMG